MISPKSKHFINSNNCRKSGVKTNLDRNSTDLWVAPKNIRYRGHPTKTHHRCSQQQSADSINQCYSLIGPPYPSEGNSEHKTQNVPHFNHKNPSYTVVNPKNKVKMEQIKNWDTQQLEMILGASPFEVSYLKMQEIKQQFLINNIELTEEVTEIVDLIKGERIKIKIIYEELLEEIKSHCTVHNQKVDTGVNTEEIIIVKDDMEDCASQYQKQELNEAKKMDQQQNRSMGLCKGFQSNSESTQAYKKIVSMLESIKINPDQILPQGCIDKQQKSEWKKSEYRQLSSKQILKFQQMFISKLVTRINDKNRKSNP